MDNVNPLYTALGVGIAIVLLLAWKYIRVKRMKAYIEYRRAVTSDNVLAMSRILLLTLDKQVKLAHKEIQFRRDIRYSVENDRATAQAAVSLFTNWYNMAVVPAIEMSSAFEDIIVTKVDRQDTDDGTWLLIHLGQGNDVVKHFLPDHGLQSFITGIRAISNYMQMGVSAHQ